jgi:hypothetical protein
VSLLTTEGRHPAVIAAARRFEIDHLTNPDARQIGMEVGRLAALMLVRIKKDDPELTKALDTLADARDGFIRAAIYTGKG